MTSCLNNLKLNIFIGFFLIIFFKKYKNQTSSASATVYFIWLLVTVILIPEVHKNLYATNFFFKKVNVALLNGVVNIHPWLTFISYGFLGLVLIMWIRLSFLKKDATNFFFKKNSLKLVVTGLISLSIFLGGYWSFQELSWGGWWNWDVVELVSLNFFFIIVALTHFKFFQFFKKKLTLIKLIVVFLIASVVVRLNLLSSIHAFINPNVSKIAMIKYILILTLIISFIRVLYAHTFSNNIKHKNLVSYFYQNIIFIVIYVIYYIVVVFIVGEDNVEWSPIIIFIFLYLSVLFFSNFISLRRNYSSIQLWPLNYVFFLTSLVYPQIFEKNKANRVIINTHIKVVVFMLIVFFLKVYTAGFNFLEEVFLKNNSHEISTYYYGNSFFLKKFPSTIFLNIVGFDVYRYFDYNAVFLSSGATHFFKNALILSTGCLIKTMFLNKNLVVLLYSGWFLSLPLLLFWFVLQKKRIIKIN